MRAPRVRRRQRPQAQSSTFISWLDLADADYERALNLLNPPEDNTVDELGLSPLAEQMSERLYPATAVAMRKARYFLFIAAIYRAIEEQEIPSVRVPGIRKRWEDKLRDLLETNGHRTDVIGRRSKEHLTRYPSSIHWKGLRDLRMFLGEKREADHVRRLDHWYERRSGVETDDQVILRPDDGLENWDPEIPFLPVGVKGDFPSDTSFTLTEDEARYLRDRYLELDRRKGTPSLMGFRLGQGLGEEYEWPWDCPVSGELTQVCEHARCLSAFARGATLHYFHMLLRRTDKRELLADVERGLKKWWRTGRPRLRTWDIDQYPEDLRPKKWASDRDFLVGWTARCLDAASPDELLRDAAATERIVNRDRLRARSRFRSAHYLGVWKPETAVREANEAELAPFRLGFRHRIGQVFVRDILGALD